MAIAKPQTDKRMICWLAYQIIIMYHGISPLGNCVPTLKLLTPFSLLINEISPRMPALILGSCKSLLRCDSCSLSVAVAITTTRLAAQGEAKLKNPRQESVEDK